MLACAVAGLVLRMPYHGWVAGYGDPGRRILLSRMLPLAQTRVAQGDLEIRVWGEFGRFTPGALILRRRSGHWTALNLPPECGGHYRFLDSGIATRVDSPRSGWDRFWPELRALGVLTLRDSRPPEFMMILDGTSYRVELRLGREYRRTMHWHPLYAREDPMSARVAAIIGLLKREFPRATIGSFDP